MAEADITHAQPVALWGQMHTRISKSAESPVTANVVALESREGDRGLDAAILVSADIIGLPHEVLVALRKRVDAAQALMVVSRKEAAVEVCAGHRYFVENILEELDSPGEWYLDRDGRKLYLWPKTLVKFVDAPGARLPPRNQVSGTEVGFRANRPEGGRTASVAPRAIAMRRLVAACWKDRNAFRRAGIHGQVTPRRPVARPSCTSPA